MRSGNRKQAFIRRVWDAPSQSELSFDVLSYCMTADFWVAYQEYVNYQVDTSNTHLRRNIDRTNYSIAFERPSSILHM